jgi:hypothetical protein
MDHLIVLGGRHGSPTISEDGSKLGACAVAGDLFFAAALEIEISFREARELADGFEGEVALGRKLIDKEVALLSCEIASGLARNCKFEVVYKLKKPESLRNDKVRGRPGFFFLKFTLPDKIWRDPELALEKNGVKEFLPNRRRKDAWME